MNSLVSLWWWRVGPVFCVWDGICILRLTNGQTLISCTPARRLRSVMPLKLEHIFLKEWDHHPSLPIQGHCPQAPHNVEDASQSWQSNNIKSFQEIWVNRFLEPKHHRIFWLHQWTQPQWWVIPPMHLSDLLPPKRACQWDSGGPQCTHSTALYTYKRSTVFHPSCKQHG